MALNLALSIRKNVPALEPGLVILVLDDEAEEAVWCPRTPTFVVNLFTSAQKGSQGRRTKQGAPRQAAGNLL